MVSSAIRIKHARVSSPKSIKLVLSKFHEKPSYYLLLLYGFAESWILISRRAVRKMRIRTVVRIFPYPDRFPVCQFHRLEFETFLHVYRVVM
jgi:hypothetical protein